MNFDWPTLAFQTVNVAVLIWLLGRFLWRPMAEMIARRRAEAEGLLKEAETQRDAAAKLQAELTKAHDEIAGARDAALAEARVAAEAERARVLAAARDEAARIEAAAKTRIASAQSEAEAAISDHAAELAVDMAKRLGHDLDGPELRAAALDRLAERLRGLPEGDRAALLDGESITVTTASPLEPEETARLETRLAEALGGTPKLAYRADPALVAGIALETPHLTVSKSWQDGLARMRQEIAGHD